MRIPTWRLVLTGTALSILVVAGIGLATASNIALAPAGSVAQAEPTAAPEGATGPRNGPGTRLLRAGRRLVHAEMTVTGRDGQLVHLQLDHGTVTSIGGGSLTIDEAGGGSEIVSINDTTVVRVGRAAGDVGDIKVGAEVFVQSRVDDGTPLAKRIVVIPAGTGT